jgi:hypothetical protein
MWSFFYLHPVCFQCILTSDIALSRRCSIVGIHQRWTKIYDSISVVRGCENCYIFCRMYSSLRRWLSQSKVYGWVEGLKWTWANVDICSGRPSTVIYVEVMGGHRSAYPGQPKTQHRWNYIWSDYHSLGRGCPNKNKRLHSVGHRNLVDRWNKFVERQSGYVEKIS